MPKLRLFLFWSVLWHIFQFVLFTAFFKVNLPKQNSSKKEGPLQVVAIQRAEVSIADFTLEKNKEILKPKAIVKNEMVKVELSQKIKQNIPKIKRKQINRKTKKVNSQYAAIPATKDVQVASTKKPFVVSSSLKLRKLTYLPKLPEYPEWALEKDISLKLKIGIQVSQQGFVKRAWVDEPSGYSRIDTRILQFVKKIEFEENPLSTRGYLYWEYQLEY